MPKYFLRKKVRVLLTGAGAPGTSGTVYLLKEGAKSDGIELNLFGTEAKAEFQKSDDFVRVFAVSRPDSGTYLSEINAIIEREKIDLIIPQTTSESAFFAVNESEVAARVSVLDAQTFEALNNKGALMDAYKEAHLPSTEPLRVNSYSEFLVALDQLGYPRKDVVVKPPNSSGMRGVRRISESAENLQTFLSEKPSSWTMRQEDLVRILGQGSWPSLIATRFLSGPEYSVDVWCRGDSKVVIPRERKEMRAGISMATKLDLHPKIIKTVNTFLKHYEIQGLLGFQFILEEGVPYILECNPRVQGSMVASLLSGVNILWLEVKYQLEIPFSTDETQVSSNTGEFRRTWSGELIFSNGRIESF
jgi:carbamoyl-phosphate synthase large subunit